MYDLMAEGGTSRDVTPAFAQLWLQDLQGEIAVQAATEGLRPRDFACTILAAVVGIDHAAFLQVGDGAMVVSAQEDPGHYSWVFWPHQGEYANVTVFATDASATEHLDYGCSNGVIDEIALFTDGLQGIALQYHNRTVYERFFHPIFAPLRAAPGGFLRGLSDLLATFLDSQSVNERTDDDKTLVLATRRLTNGLTTMKADSRG
jgi:hypothetical protein